MDSMARLGAERQERQEMEQRLEEMARELRELRHFPSDSDNAEFLDTIEAQKLQVLSLEESLQQERETLCQLQQLLEVERNRGRKDPDPSSGGRLEEVTAKLRQDLNKERGVRKRLEDSVSLDEVGQLVVRQLHLDLQHERTQVKELEASVERERRRYKDAKAELDQLKLRASVFHQGSDTSIFRPPTDNAGDRQMKDRNLQLERRTAELEVIIEEAERETDRLRDEVARLQMEVQGEREKGMSGMSAEQLARMRHINSFLEHNLRENGEMLASLGKLQEEKQEMKAMNWTLKERLADCVCSTTEERGKTLYGRYLRAESFRKALVWQKRYLVVLLTGETGEGDDREPVLAIQRPRQLPKQGKWRSLVHAIIAISRMKFLVRRWRSGKRAGARLTTASPLPSPSTSLRGGSVPALPSPLHPPTFGRSHSLRSTSRPSTLGLRSHQYQEQNSPPSLSTSSPSSSQQRPLSSLASGLTPPTRDREQRCSVGNAVLGNGEVRRSLGSQFGGDHTIAGVQDLGLRRELEEYTKRFGNLQEKMGSRP